MRENNEQIMAGVDPLRVVKQKRIANNTVEYVLKDGTRKIRLHRADILTFLPNGSIIYNSGGWRTNTTKDRINEHQNKVRIYTQNGVWYVSAPFLCGSPAVFKDGMIYLDRPLPPHLKGTGSLVDERELLDKIRAYAKLCVATLPLPPPSAGDCMYCHLRDTETRKPWGDTNKDHLLSHIEEKYVVPSLVWNVLVDAGCDPKGIKGNVWFQEVFAEGGCFVDKASVQRQVAQWIVKYIHRRVV